MERATATGTFEELTPVGAPDAPIGAMTIAKTFHGDIDGSSAGQMLAVRTAVDGSAGYVAMERVTATVAGRGGTFALQHSGTMDKGAPSLSVTVVPDSGDRRPFGHGRIDGHRDRGRPALLHVPLFAAAGADGGLAGARRTNLTAALAMVSGGHYQLC